MNSQNSFVRFKVGQPVVPVVNSLQLKRKSHCETCNEEYYGHYDKHCMSHHPNNGLIERYQKKIFRIKPNTFSNHNSVNVNRSINNYDNNYLLKNNTYNSRVIKTPFLNGVQFKKQGNKKLPAYSGSEKIGVETLVRVDGFFCTICDEYVPAYKFDTHCKSKVHYDNFMSNFHLASKPKPSFLTNGKATPSKGTETVEEDEFHGDLDHSANLLSDEVDKDSSTRPQIIVKIENSDTLVDETYFDCNDMSLETLENNKDEEMDDDKASVASATISTQRRPISERLGTIVNKKKTASSNPQLLKPSSHLVPTRKVYVDNAKINGNSEDITE